MQTTLRLFALAIAVAGLASAAFAPAASHAQPKHVPLTVSSPGLSEPAPVPWPTGR